MAELSAQEAYKGKSRKCEKDFTMKREMTFMEIILYMLCAAKASTWNALERAFPQMKKENMTITQQAIFLCVSQVLSITEKTPVGQVGVNRGGVNGLTNAPR